MTIVNSKDLNIGPVLNRWNFGLRVNYIENNSNSVF
eukprot:CAMPEP_0202968488 /NCGR_PEP_ID=MMETSP1396-20130829/13817_1 /ASSEMBLY_ACC=CAM_ASM_000872 /TAXON_ID= /ORGANISM="Pseudokeronopsis sp., Strain Brazil" /LENGTH=35 /DNA_ID= /DNA_START= /DNA_END= /DNA_ORIENTATION=